MERLARVCGVAALLLLAGCQALSGSDSVATIGADLTMYAAEGDAILAGATAEQIMARETIAAAGTKVAQLSAVNAALGATVRASFTGTPALRAVVVSADDMGGSLGDDMMEDGEASAYAQDETNLRNISTAAGTLRESGCSSGIVTQFRPTAERIYVTAEVIALHAGTTFSVDWMYEDALLADVSWQADYSTSFECIWFYATPQDFEFTPGNYSARVYVNGLEVGNTGFTILGS